MDHAPCYVIRLFPLITNSSFTIRWSARGLIISFPVLAFMALLQENQISMIKTTKPLLTISHQIWKSQLSVANILHSACTSWQMGCNFYMPFCSASDRQNEFCFYIIISVQLKSDCSHSETSLATIQIWPVYKRNKLAKYSTLKHLPYWQIKIKKIFR